LADQSIKQGKLAFTWKQLRAWATPSAPAGYESAQDDQLLELPLAVVVPLYFAQRKPVRSGKLMNVPDVPDLFARPAAKPSDAMVATPPQGAPAAAPPVPVHAAPSTAAAPSPVPAAAAAPPPSVSITPAAGQPTPDIGQVFGQAGKRHWTPAEIVQKTATLPGVSGSLIAMQDGLLVACQMPANLNGEMIAAFLPQMFGRMSHYTSELKLGEPSSVLLMVNQIPLQINRVGRVFYTVLGKPGEPLPSPAIAAVVVQLDLQSKQI
jgi:predicted regulator of Ras-like GTPase activity (Roadblock/LC7/MglB family)